MIDYIKGFEFMTTMGFFVYWIPALVCLLCYAIRCGEEYKSDLSRCEGKFYIPRLTVGAIFGRFVVSVTPCVNLFALVFDCMASILKYFGVVFNIPLVKARSPNSYGEE